MTLLFIVIVVITVTIVLILGLFIWTVRQNNDARLLPPTNTQPEWMRVVPPQETIAATLANGNGIQLYDDDEEEALASPFAEQIEDIVQAKLNTDPDLKQYKVDLGTAPDGGLEILVNGVRYAAIVDIPDAKLRAALNEAIEAWGKS